MPKVLRPKPYQVELSDHAWQRFCQRSEFRASRKKLLRRLKAQINTQLAVGMRLDKTSAGWLEVYPGVWAAVRLKGACWMVMTFIDEWSGLAEKEAVG
ncbi:hypothetical protein [Desulfoscipio geothermicus]|uniref:Uncharacterized protein n=1 Tax=Desulfoscipio geothermicus DSM 3669 TaxID=1121426 RepID=A0A1I6EC29_9FIRM|nr:hypothetical protein [Desulfoscipio geothermicus]SFR15313.1 hypothetical protein SAMN05660706_13520 [Desulfoscipio geothermicus DSM 3669]